MEPTARTKFGGILSLATERWPRTLGRMDVHRLAGQLPPRELWLDVERLCAAYASRHPDPAVAAE